MALRLTTHTHLNPSALLSGLIFASTGFAGDTTRPTIAAQAVTTPQQAGTSLASAKVANAGEKRTKPAARELLLTTLAPLDVYLPVRRDIGAGNANPGFSRFTATVSLTPPFEIDGRHFKLSSVMTGQLSPDNVFGAEQIAIGGHSNVSGTREAPLFGNDGFFSRNDFIWRTEPEATARRGSRPFAGLELTSGLTTAACPRSRVSISTVAIC